ncbi:MAG: flagellar basal body rod protein FlgB [Desulforhopalus sp.]|nr:flagellar basal body rod protein FlgB [Desulforhopalus sp.]
MDPLKPFDSNMQLLSKVLDLRAQKAQVISSNIANAETPGYSAQRFNFEEDLAMALRGGGVKLTTSHSAHIPLGPSNFHSVTGKIVTIEDKTGIGDKNSVSVNQEMTDLSENELLYETAAQLLKKKITQLNMVLTGQ